MVLLSPLLLSFSLGFGPELALEGSRYPLPWWKRCSSHLVRVERPEPELVTRFGKWIPVPFGLNPDRFLHATLEIFQVHPLVNAVIYHGSRTHFEYGYLPESDSDLDMLVLYDGTPIPDFRAPLKSVFEVDFPVNVSFRSAADLVETFQSRSFQFPTTKQEDEYLQALAHHHAAGRWFGSGDWKESWQVLAAERNPLTLQDRLATGHVGQTALFSRPPVLLALGKQAVIFVRDSDNWPTHLRLLREVGFFNIGVVDPNAPGSQRLGIPGRVPRYPTTYEDP